MVDLKGFENLYKINTKGEIFSIRSVRNLKPNKSGKYPRIKLSKNGKDYMFSIHRLVAETFLENEDNKPIVNHKDGDKNNYDLSNLEFVTYSENNKHFYDSGLCNIKKGIELSSSKLNEKEVIEIYHSTDIYSKISELYGVSKATISKIKNNKIWKYLNKEMDINLVSLNKNYNSEINFHFDYNNYKYIENHENYRIDINGCVINSDSKKIKESNDRGYLRIQLNGKNYYIHRLVAITFIDNVNNYLIVNHKDGNKLNNNVNNLEWCNSSYNSLHAFSEGLRKPCKGECVGTSKLTECEVIKIYNSNKKYSEIMSEFNISRGTVSMIKNKKIWKHVL